MHDIPRYDPVQATPFVSNQERTVWLQSFGHTDKPPFREEHLNHSSQGVVKLTPRLKDGLKVPCAEKLVPLLELVQQGLKEMNPRHRFVKAESKGGDQVSDRNWKLVLFRIHIYADAKNSRADLPIAEDSLYQDTPNLPTGNQNVVWPFELRSHPCFLNCRSHGHACG
jgi:hypothetical protein